VKQLETSKILARSIRGAWCCTLVVTLVFGFAERSLAEEPGLPGPHGAAGEGVEHAEAYAAQAFQAYAQRDYDKAVALYLQAYEAAPSADILFNIARVHDVGMQDVALSISFYQDYVLSPDAEPHRIEIARARIQRLSAIETAVRERSAHAAADVASAPLEGASARDLARPGGAAAASGAARGRAASSSSAAEVDGWTPWRVGALVAGGIGVVSVGLGAGFGVAALSDAATARKDCAGNVCSSRRGVEAARAAAKSADIATVGFALGGSLLAASLASMLFDLDSPPGHDTIGSSGLRPVATTSELGLAMSGRW
jgi:tetratricopeptide (TPR) repeat protein